MRNRRGKLGLPREGVNGSPCARRATRGVRRVASLLAASGIALLLGACALTTRDVPRDAAPKLRDYLATPARDASAEERVDTAPQQLWKGRFGRGQTGLPLLGDRIALFASVDRWLYAVDPRTGRPYWRHRADGPFGPGPLADHGRVYAATAGPLGRVIAVGLHNGKRRWTARVGSVTAPLALGDSAVYGVTTAGLAFALRIDNGRPFWSRDLGSSASGPLVMGDAVAFVTRTDTLVTLGRARGEIRGQVPIPTSTTAPLARIDDSTAAIASPAGAVIAVGLPRGEVRWRVPTGSPVRGAPVVARDTVWALTQDCTLWRIPLAAPARADSASIGCVTEAAPAVLRDGVLVATVGGDVILYDPAARRRVWTRTVRGPLGHPPVVRRGQVLVAPTLGDVVSFR